MRIPVATYRIQFNSDFQFNDARVIVPYLKELGISDLYASPVFKATAGSTHGYDVVDPRQLNPELGSTEDFETLVQTLHEQQMGWLQDIVPNHMAYNSRNEFLMDVLEYGPHSEYFNFFDIEWEHPYSDIQSKVLAPLLGDFYGNCLENGELQLKYDEAGLSINYYGLKFPLRIESYPQLITYDLGRLGRSLGRKHPDFIKLLGILYLLRGAIAEAVGQQHRDQAAFAKGLLWELYQSNSEIQAFINQNLDLFNGKPGDAASFDLLHSMLSDQYFRLSFWKVGAEELNYRRFFTVNELICVSVEDFRVFKTTHSLIQSLVQQGKFNGVRIDHIDGLYDPKQYLERLRELLGDTYITVEKILEPGEELPEDWPMQGTSGYNFLNYLNGLFCQTANEEDFTRIYQGFTGLRRDYHELEITCKRLIADKNLAGDVENLANLLKRIAGRYRYASDFTLSGLRRAIVEVLVLFPIYRTYITAEGIGDRDRTYIEEVIQAAKSHVPQLINELNFIEKVLLLDHEDAITEDEKAQWMHFIMRIQQYSGPLMAKGVEDTLLYVYYRLLSLNEVGGSPYKFGITVPEFHAYNQQQVTQWPHAMNASSTHDTKRSEDVRARLNVLSEMPEDWQTEVETWRALNRQFRTEINGHLIPDANDEYFVYQTLVGAFPFEPYDHNTFVQRIKDYAIKSVREAKVHTAWLRPDTDYEEGFIHFIEQLLEPRDDNEFLQKLRHFQARIAFYGICNGLSQTLVKITAPGVPDIYQGTELWDLSLVDPDNRRPVNYEQRLNALRDIRQRSDSDRMGLLEDLKANATDGRIKLFTLHKALEARAQHLQIFQEGEYLPIKVAGQHQDHLVAFARQAGDRMAITVVPRFLSGLVEPGLFPLGKAVWGDTRLEIPNGDHITWTEAMTQRAIAGSNVLAVGDILEHFPVALLISN